MVSRQTIVSPLTFLPCFLPSPYPPVRTHCHDHHLRDHGPRRGASAVYGREVARVFLLGWVRGKKPSGVRVMGLFCRRRSTCGSRRHIKSAGTPPLYPPPYPSPPPLSPLCRSYLSDRDSINPWPKRVRCCQRIKDAKTQKKCQARRLGTKRPSVT